MCFSSTKHQIKFKMAKATRLRNTYYPRTLLLLVSQQNYYFKAIFISLLYCCVNPRVMKKKTKSSELMLSLDAPQRPDARDSLECLLASLTLVCEGNKLTKSVVANLV